METYPMKRSFRFLQIASLLAPVLIGSVIAPSASAKDSVAYKPGISLVPEVYRPDGVTDQTYKTGSVLSLWTSEQPIPQGDKIKLNVFAATGGAELKEIKIRLDNTLIADITKAPWHTVLDTATLSTGFHMVEVWAVATGDKPQSTTQTLSFKVDPAVLVQGEQQTLGPNGATENSPSTGGTEPSATFSDTPPALPGFLANATADPSATVAVTVRSAASGQSAGGAAISDAPITINEPTLFLVQPVAGGTATGYAYAIVRDDKTVATSPKVLNTSYDRIRIEQRTDTQAGLRPGKVTLWIWGVDKQGNYSDPTKTYLDIASN
jgi:hypothetical protein